MLCYEEGKCHVNVRLIRSLLLDLCFAAAEKWSLRFVQLCHTIFLPEVITACHYHSEPPGGTCFLIKPNLAFQKGPWKMNWH